VSPARRRGRETSRVIQEVAAKTMTTVTGFYFGLPDLTDGKPWTEMDERDLRAAIEHGSTLEEQLCRSGTLTDVAKKAEELGLNWHIQKSKAS
jgi:hypothetical protein